MSIKQSTQQCHLEMKCFHSLHGETCVSRITEDKPHPSDPRLAGLVPPAAGTLALPGAHSGAPATAHKLRGCQAHGTSQEVLTARPSLGHLDHLKPKAFKRSHMALYYFIINVGIAITCKLILGLVQQTAPGAERKSNTLLQSK